MPIETGYKVGVVLVNRYEPEHEVGARLLEVAEELGYSSRVIEAQRGEHETALSFRAPEDVVDAFNADRSDRWSYKIENDGEKDPDQGPAAAGVNEDAFSADNERAAHRARVAAAAEEQDNAPARATRTDKKPKE